MTAGAGAPVSPHARQPGARLFSAGALLCLLGVAAGAFGAHALGDHYEPRMLEVFEIAVRYQIYSGIGLLAAAWAAERWPGPWPRRAGWLLGIGTLLFSGSLYVLVLSGVRQLGAITPLGGVCLMAGWLCLTLAPTRRRG
jgi:uncharacterized membrane protein YgdD (TMEM256/DUF423 family)